MNNIFISNMNININLNINISYPPRPASPRDSIADQPHRSKQTEHTPTSLEAQQDGTSLPIEQKTGEGHLSTIIDDSPWGNHEQSPLEASHSAHKHKARTPGQAYQSPSFRSDKNENVNQALGSMIDSKAKEVTD